jgi:D-tyrosyl-tRNA(Tyr) deacylase
MADKVVGLRIFADPAGKMNRSVAEVEGQILVVSQFTLYGDARKGRRPSFDGAAPAETARRLFEQFADRLRASGLTIRVGRFQEHMQVESANDGPVTILVDSPTRTTSSDAPEYGHGR